MVTVSDSFRDSLAMLTSITNVTLPALSQTLRAVHIAPPPVPHTACQPSPRAPAAVVRGVVRNALCMVSAAHQQLRSCAQLSTQVSALVRGAP